MGFALELRDTNSHIKRTLPPTFKGFPGLVEIRYYVKVTVEYPQFYKGNLRGVSRAYAWAKEQCSHDLTVH